MPALAATAPIDETSLLVIVGVAALAGLLTMVLAPRLTIPVVVLELLLGIIVGPEVLDSPRSTRPPTFSATSGWGCSSSSPATRSTSTGSGVGRWNSARRLGDLAVLAYGIGGALAAAGVVLSYLYTGSAMATTAIGTLIPILRDAGELRTRFGSYLLAAGAVGEFGPILLITLILSTANPLHEALVLVLFVALAVVTGVAAVRSAWKGWPLVERAFETSSQLAVRLAVVLVFGLVALAAELGLDLLLGGFVAGMITRVALRGREVSVFDSKLTAVGYGLPDPVLLRHQRDELRPQRAHLERLRDAEAAVVPGALPGGARDAGAAALPGRARRPRPPRAGVLLRHRAAAGGRDHHRRHRNRAR